MTPVSVPRIRRSASGGDTAPRRTDPRSFLVASIAGLPRAVLPLAAVLYSTRDQPLGFATAIFIAAGIIAVMSGFAYLAWLRTTYSVGAADIRVETGIIARAARSVPFERIQDVSLQQSLIPRLFGLVEVRFETGAGGTDEVKLAYLSQTEGERLRELVRDRSDAVPPPAGTERTDAEGEDVLFAIPPRRVLAFGLFEFSLAIVAVLGGLAQQLDFLLPFDLWDLNGWQDRLAGQGAWLAGIGPAAQLVGAVAVLALLGTSGLLTGVVRTAAREWGFVLTRNAKGFRRRRGLFTRTDVVMPVHRVQALSVRTGAVRRLWGWHSLSFVTLAQDAGAASHIVAPFARQDEIAPIIRAAGFEEAGHDAAWHRTSRRQARDAALVRLLALAIPAAVLEVVLWSTPEVDSALFVALPAVLGGVGVLLALHAWWNWHHRRYALTSRQLLHRHGRLSPALDIASRVKLQSVSLVQGPLARRHGYATLHLGVAGGRIAIPGLPAADALRLRRELLASMTATDFSELV